MSDHLSARMSAMEWVNHSVPFSRRNRIPALTPARASSSITIFKFSVRIGSLMTSIHSS